MSLGKAMLVPNPNEFTPTVAQDLGLNPAIPMLASVNPMRNEAAFAPVQYIGNYPVFQNDRSFMTWSNACQASK